MVILGDQHFTTDFLYQTEWQEWLKDGVLGKMDVAFSRDTGEKYTSNIVLEHSKEFNEWLQKVLHFTFVVMKTYGERCTSSYPQCFNERTKLI